jgi:hypothetical protein
LGWIDWIGLDWTVLIRKIDFSDILITSLILVYNYAKRATIQRLFSTPTMSEQEMPITPDISELEYYKAKSEQSDEVIAYMQKQQAIKNRDHFLLLKENTDLKEKVAKQAKEIEELRGLLSNASQRTVSDFGKVLTFKPKIAILQFEGKNITNMGYPLGLYIFLKEELLLAGVECITKHVNVMLNFDDSLKDESILELKEYDLLLIPEFSPNSGMVSGRTFPLIEEFNKYSLKTFRIFVEPRNQQTHGDIVQRKDISELIFFFEGTDCGTCVCEMNEVGHNMETFHSLLKTLRKML